jgi:hypothetical protein
MEALGGFCLLMKVLGPFGGKVRVEGRSYCGTAWSSRLSCLINSRPVGMLQACALARYERYEYRWVDLRVWFGNKP